MKNLNEYKNIVVLTGAGISAESGIKTFRDANGLWEDHHIEDVASPEGFTRNPTLVHNFYNARRQQLLSNEVKENAAHIALAEFEKNFTGNFLLVTQNVDDLHERAGSKNIIHMHGELLKMFCQFSDEVFSCKEDISTESVCDCCNKTNSLRPDIVWFGEMPYHMGTIQHALEQADCFVSIGTSGNVYPAAGFVQLAKASGADTLELNLEASEVNRFFDKSVQEKASEAVPRYFK